MIRASLGGKVMPKASNNWCTNLGSTILSATLIQYISKEHLTNTTKISMHQI